MRFKIIIVNAGIVVLTTILTYVLLVSSLKGIVADTNERKREVERALRAATSQLALDALRLERWLEGTVGTEAVRSALGMPTPEARQQAAFVEANRLREAAQSDARFARMTPSLVALVDADGVVASRDGSILSMVLRNGWDGQPLRSRVKQQKLLATDYHLSAIGHITREELTRSLTSTGMNKVAGSPQAKPGRKPASQDANASAGRMRRMSSASTSAGDRKSAPDGSHAAGTSRSSANHSSAFAHTAVVSASS